MINPMLRQARLKPEYAELYPGIEAGVWVPAADAAAQVLAMMRGASRAFEDRVMNERHFEFQGGLPAPRPHVRSRLADLGGG
jgi:hypothetical protein